MIFRTLGRTGLRVSAVSFGAGPVSGLMTGTDTGLQRATVARALEADINWFDTAAGYGQGRSEANLGRVLGELGVAGQVHVATKVRIPPEALGSIPAYIRQSVGESLSRLGLPAVTLLQLHNGITSSRDDEPASITPADVLGGVAEGFRELRREGLVRFVGLTGTGQPEALREVVRSGEFDTHQVPFNLLNRSAGSPEPPAAGDTDYGNIIVDCVAAGMGVFAIRVFAGGALLGQPPSAHTLKTPYFPRALYERDAGRAEELRQRLRGGLSMPELAVRFVLRHPAVSSAIIGFGSPEHVEEVTGFALDAPLPNDHVVPE